MVSLLPIRASAASHFTEKSIKMEGDGQSRYKKESSQVKTGCPRNRKTLQSLLGIGRRIYLSWSLHPHCRESLVSGQRSRQACQLSWWHQRPNCQHFEPMRQPQACGDGCDWRLAFRVRLQRASYLSREWLKPGQSATVNPNFLPRYQRLYCGEASGALFWETQPLWVHT